MIPDVLFLTWLLFTYKLIYKLDTRACGKVSLSAVILILYVKLCV